ncbi:MAG: outer membrane protein assembly factor BamD [Calditrichaeota bacterium]|nr:outer membrane protein assembly factor BamD [Calditrichota bacterium]
MKKILTQSVMIILLLMLATIACNRNKIKPTASAEERMKIAEKMFKDEDYLDARTQFRIIIYNFPGSAVSARAQYMFAECYFKTKEYLIAAAEYEKLLRVYANSEYVDDAQFKIALCYYKLSPKYSLDQEYTRKAVEELQKFLEDYPNSELAKEANVYLHKCRSKLGKKYYKSGEIYQKMAFYKSAIIYYDYVLDNYYDTEFAPKALIGKAECYQDMKKNDEAIKFYQLYLEKYPKGSSARKVKSILEKLKKSKQG